MKTREVVINTCYGGFSISPLATQMIAKLRGKECYFFKMVNLDTNEFKQINIEECDKEAAFWAYTIKNPNKYKLQKPWKDMTIKERICHHDTIGYKLDEFEISGWRISREDPNLVKTVKKLKDKANGSHAKLKIVKIPADVKYIIEEYDGMEHVAECHRTWN